MVNGWASLLGSYLGLLGGILRVIVSKSLAVGKLSASRAGLAPWEAGPHGGGGGGGGVGCGGRKRSLGIYLRPCQGHRLPAWTAHQHAGAQGPTGP